MMVKPCASEGTRRLARQCVVGIVTGCSRRAEDRYALVDAARGSRKPRSSSARIRSSRSGSSACRATQVGPGAIEQLLVRASGRGLRAASTSSVMTASPGVGRPTNGVTHADHAIGQHLGVHAAAPVGVEGLLVAPRGTGPSIDKGDSRRRCAGECRRRPGCDHACSLRSRPLTSTLALRSTGSTLGVEQVARSLPSLTRDDRDLSTPDIGIALDAMPLTNGELGHGAHRQTMRRLEPECCRFWPGHGLATTSRILHWHRCAGRETARR